MNSVDKCRMKRRICHGCSGFVNHIGLLAWCNKCMNKARKTQAETKKGGTE